MRIQVRNIEAVSRLLNNLSQREAKYALSSVLNKAAFAVMKAEREEIKTTFDRPTPFVSRGVVYQKSNKTTLQSRVYMKEITQFTLQANILGEQRQLKPIEERMKSAGIMQNDLFLVPAKDAPRDRFGNLAKTKMEEIIYSIPALARSGSFSKYFVSKKSGRTAHLFPGIWEKVGAAGFLIYPILLFVNKASYQARYKFHETAEDVVNQNINTMMTESVEKAIERSRR
jgi:hypothetical protein